MSDEQYPHDLPQAASDRRIAKGLLLLCAAIVIAPAIYLTSLMLADPQQRTANSFSQLTASVVFSTYLAGQSVRRSRVSHR